MESSMNRAVVVGTITEVNYKYDAESESKNKKVKKGAWVKDDFKNPIMRVLVDKGDEKSYIDVQMFPTYENYESNGVLKENSTFKEFNKLSNLENRGVGARIKLTGQFTENKYVKEDGKTIARFNQFNAQYISLSDVGQEDFAEGSLTGVISNMVDEVVNDEPTGRMLVEFYTFMGKTDVKSAVLNLIVPEELVDDVNSEFSIGSNAEVDVEIKTVTHGAVQNTSTDRGFGSRKANIKSGYTTTEFQIFSGYELDDTNEADLKYILTDEEFKNMLKKRKLELEQLVQEKNHSSGQTARRSGLGNRTARTEVTATTNEELPFTPDSENPFA